MSKVPLQKVGHLSNLTTHVETQMYKYSALPLEEIVEIVKDLKDLCAMTDDDGQFPDVELHDLMRSYRRVFEKIRPKASANDLIPIC